jgi:hypothetical protein
MSTYGPDHAEWADAVGAYLLRALEPEEFERFEAHLAECPRCLRDVAELRVAADALPVSVPLVSPSPALKGRIMAVVNSEAQLLAAAGRACGRARARAVLRPRPRALRRTCAPALVRWARRLADASRRRARLRGLLLAGGGAAGVLLSGDEATRTVVATTQSPAADVRLEIGEEGATLLATNMPAPPRGRVYQVWIKRPGRIPSRRPRCGPRAATDRLRSRCRARSTASRRCSSPTSPWAARPRRPSLP